MRLDRYFELRIRMTGLFHENNGRYDYRRIYAALRSGGVSVSEKTVCRIVREGHLVAKRPHEAQVRVVQG